MPPTYKTYVSGGEGGIRTLGTLTGTPDFESGLARCSIGLCANLFLHFGFSLPCNCVADVVFRVNTLARFFLLLALAATVNAGIIPLTATRSIRVTGTGTDGSTFDESTAPASAFAPFDERLIEGAPHVFSDISQRSSIQYNGIGADGRLLITTGPADSQAQTGRASYESVFRTTFTVDAITPFTLDGYFDEGNYTGIRFNFSGSVSGQLAFWGPFDPSVGNIVAISGDLTPQIYTLEITFGPGELDVQTYPQAGHGYYRMNLVANVPDSGTTAALFGAGVLVLIGLRRRNP